FEHHAVISGLAELVGCREPRHSGAEHDHLGSVPRAGRKRERLGDGGGAQEAHRLHGEVGGAIASGLRDPAQELPTGAGHRNLMASVVARIEPTGPRETRADDRLREIRVSIEAWSDTVEISLQAERSSSP